ncbi:MAG: nodulation protein NfeD [Syntrophaceae bacterium]
MGRHQKSHGILGVALAALIQLLFPLAADASDVIVLEVKDTITPPVAAYITENIDQAVRENAHAVIIRLDTPGGLDTAMREIIQKELNAPIPVVVYVSPKGARAASAGALICLAADVAAMAPGTNIGAAHPVGIGPGGGGEEDKGANTMVEKVTNDAVAYARSIARERGRNEEWAIQAVSKSISTPAREALEKHVIDIIADNLDDLLVKLDGRVIKKGNATITLKTKQARLKEQPMDFRTRLLSTISNPNVAYILMLIGLAGIYFELSSPGAILPGIIGGISLILAFFAFQTLPVNYAGVALILLAVILFFAEIKVPSYGLLTVGGIISMVFGSLLLFRTPELYAQVSLGVILPITVFFAAFFTLCVYLVVKVHRTAPSTGAESLVGEKAHVYAWTADGTGKVFTHGEYWNARGPATIKPGDIVEVERVEGMVLTIKPQGDGA